MEHHRKTPFENDGMLPKYDCDDNLFFFGNGQQFRIFPVYLEEYGRRLEEYGKRFGRPDIENLAFGLALRPPFCTFAATHPDILEY